MVAGLLLHGARLLLTRSFQFAARHKITTAAVADQAFFDGAGLKTLATASKDFAASAVPDIDIELKHAAALVVPAMVALGALTGDSLSARIMNAVCLGALALLITKLAELGRLTGDGQSPSVDGEALSADATASADPSP